MSPFCLASSPVPRSAPAQQPPRRDAALDLNVYADQVDRWQAGGWGVFRTALGGHDCPAGPQAPARGTRWPLCEWRRALQVPVPRQEASMAEKAAGPERSGDKASAGGKPGSPDQAGAAGQAKSGGGGRQDKASSADEAQPKFREALER